MKQFIGFVHESEIGTAMFGDVFFSGKSDFRASPEKSLVCGNIRFS